MKKQFRTSKRKDGSHYVHPISEGVRESNAPSMQVVKLKTKDEWRYNRRYAFNLEYSDGKHEVLTVIANDPEEAFDKAMDKRERQGSIPVGVKMHNQAEALLVEYAMQKAQSEQAAYEARKLAKAEAKYRRKAENAVINRKINRWMDETGSAWRPTEREKPSLYQVSNKEIEREMRRRGYDSKLAAKKAQIKAQGKMASKGLSTMFKEVKRDVAAEKTTATAGGMPASQQHPELGEVPWWSNAYKKSGGTKK